MKLTASLGKQGGRRYGLSGLGGTMAVWLRSVGTSALVIADAATQATATVTRAIRRLRQSPYLSQERVWLFFDRFQLEMETGVGLTSGADPQVLLRWSDDRGHTWSNDHWMSAGKIGQYKRRARWQRLGRARDRIFQVVISDPIATTLLDGLVDVTVGRR